MGAPWSKEQHAKFRATMRAKRIAKKSGSETHLPLNVIPHRLPARSSPKPPKNELMIEIAPGSEFSVMLGGRRVSIRTRMR